MPKKQFKTAGDCPHLRVVFGVNGASPLFAVLKLLLVIAAIVGNRGSTLRNGIVAGPAQSDLSCSSTGPLALAGLSAGDRSLLSNVDASLAIPCRYECAGIQSGCIDQLTFPVSPDLAAVVGDRDFQFHDQSGGTFDITVARRVMPQTSGRVAVPGILGARRSCANPPIRPTELLEAARARAPPAIRKLRGGVALDLNGIAPGFAVDRIAQCLERHR